MEECEINNNVDLYVPNMYRTIKLFERKILERFTGIDEEIAAFQF